MGDYSVIFIRIEGRNFALSWDDRAETRVHFTAGLTLTFHPPGHTLARGVTRSRRSRPTLDPTLTRSVEGPDGRIVATSSRPVWLFFPEG